MNRSDARTVLVPIAAHGVATARVLIIGMTITTTTTPPAGTG